MTKNERKVLNENLRELAKWVLSLQHGGSIVAAKGIQEVRKNIKSILLPFNIKGFEMNIRNLFSSSWEVEHKYYLMGKICNNCDSLYAEESDPHHIYSYSKTISCCYKCGNTDLRPATILRKISKRYTILGTRTKHSQELGEIFNNCDSLQMNRVLPKIIRLIGLVKEHTNESYQNWFHKELLPKLPSNWIRFGKEPKFTKKKNMKQL